MSAPTGPVRLVFCDKCGCNYLDGCPDETHPGYRKPDPPPVTQRSTTWAWVTAENEDGSTY